MFHDTTSGKVDIADLRGLGEELLTLAHNYATPQQWAAWLRVPLGGAAVEGDVRMVDLLIAAGADAGSGTREDGATLLHAAAEGGSKRIVQTLLEAGCESDLDCQETIGDKLSALHVTATEGHSRAAGVLIRAGANLELTSGLGHGRTPLHCAALHGHENVVVDLLLNGADKEREDDEGSRPLHLAIEGGHRDVLKLLLRAGASPDCEQRRTGRRPLYMAALGGHHKMMRELIEKGADKDVRFNRGRGLCGNFTALHAAAELGGVDAIAVLVEAGADLEVPTDQMSTPMHLAASAGATDAVVALLHAGADPHARDSEGATPLHNGCKFLQTAVVHVLVDWGADTTAVDNMGLLAEEVVGMRIQDGGEGSKEQADDILDALGWDGLPLPGSIEAPHVAVANEVCFETMSSVGLFSFPKLLNIFACTRAK